MHPALEAALSFGLSALDTGYLHRESIPEGALVKLLDRRHALEASLVPAPRNVIGKVLALLGNMPAKSVPNEEELAAFLTQDIEDLSDISSWALEDAARAYRRAEIGDGLWRPTAGQLRKEAREREVPARAELHRISKLLGAKALELPRPEYIPKSEVEAIHARIRSIANNLVVK